MASKKSDDDLIAQVVRELESAGEAFTFDRVDNALATRTTAKSPQLGPGPEVPATVVKRVLAAHGPEAVVALGRLFHEGDLGLGGDAHVSWVSVTARVIPRGRERVALFNDGHWRTMDPGAAAWQAVLSSLPLDLDDDAVAESMMRAFEALAGPVLRDVEAARQIAAPVTDEEASWRVPPSPGDAEIVTLFEPPHREGRHRVFCANLLFHAESRSPACVRVVVDIDTLASTITRLCTGRARGQQFVLRGRPFVDNGLAVTAPVTTTTATTTAAAAWRDAAAAEHASIASFARATLELMAVGAPLSLIDRTQQAAVDEVRHTRLSLIMARRLADDAVNSDNDDDDAGEAPGAFGPLPPVAPRPTSIALVATTTLTEAAVPETLAAFAAGVAARRCRDAGMRAVLDAIHADETRHAALAWDIVDWCVASDDDARAAVAALAGAITPPTASASMVDSDDDGQLTAASELRAFAVAFQERVLPRLRGYGAG